MLTTNKHNTFIQMDKRKLEQQKLLRQMTEELHSKLYPKKQQNTFLLNTSEYPRTLCSHHLHITRWHAQVQKEKKKKKNIRGRNPHEKGKSKLSYSDSYLHFCSPQPGLKRSLTEMVECYTYASLCTILHKKKAVRRLEDRQNWVKKVYKEILVCPI